MRVLYLVYRSLINNPYQITIQVSFYLSVFSLKSTPQIGLVSLSAIRDCGHSVESNNSLYKSRPLEDTQVYSYTKVFAQIQEIYGQNYSKTRWERKQRHCKDSKRLQAVGLTKQPYHLHRYLQKKRYVFFKGAYPALAKLLIAFVLMSHPFLCFVSSVGKCQALR